ncbi:hypothetical protein J8273_6984 [Carpediemonas membranifera]|uniref:Uncharacterized protein n=1 Tax=Carpediemonas membranifera TaxID=201153 RepID=A0A8J6DZQ1_9EUKA|nr:hypothetical protein J8273_6984 [Carpediemonas membranifera]|eukprot:KAG9390731.1 hypothetical protein J8273_6984 [Carpediemonas membranifera]
MDLDRIKTMDLSEVYKKLTTILEDGAFKNYTSDYGVMKRYSKYGKALFDRISALADTMEFPSNDPNAVDGVPTMDMVDLSLSSAPPPPKKPLPPPPDLPELAELMPVVKTDPDSGDEQAKVLAWEVILGTYITRPANLPVRKARDPEAVQPDILMTRLRVALGLGTAKHMQSAELLSLCPPLPVMSLAQPFRTLVGLYQALSGTKLDLKLRHSPFAVHTGDIPCGDITQITSSDPAGLISCIQRQIALLVAGLTEHCQSDPILLEPLVPHLSVVSTLLLPVLNPPLDHGQAVAQASALIPRFTVSLAPLITAAGDVLVAMASDPSPPAPPSKLLPIPAGVAVDVIVPLYKALLTSDLEIQNDEFKEIQSTLATRLFSGCDAAAQFFALLSALHVALEAPADATELFQAVIAQEVSEPQAMSDYTLKWVKLVISKSISVIETIFTRPRCTAGLAIAGIHILPDIACRHTELLVMRDFIDSYVSTQSGLWASHDEFSVDLLESARDSTMDAVVKGHLTLFESIAGRVVDNSPPPDFRTKVGGGQRTARERRDALDQWNRGIKAKELAALCTDLTQELKLDLDMFLPRLEGVLPGVTARILTSHSDRVISRISKTISDWTMTTVSLPHARMIGTKLDGLVHVLQGRMPDNTLPSVTATLSSAYSSWMSQMEEKVGPYIKKAIETQTPVTTTCKIEDVAESFTVNSAVNEIYELISSAVDEVLYDENPSQFAEHLLNQLGRLVMNVTRTFLNALSSAFPDRPVPKMSPLWTDFSLGTPDGVTPPNLARGKGVVVDATPFESTVAINDIRSYLHNVNSLIVYKHSLGKLEERIRARFDSIHNSPATPPEVKAIMPTQPQDPEVEKGKRAKLRGRKVRKEEPQTVDPMHALAEDVSRAFVEEGRPRVSLALTFISKAVTETSHAIDAAIEASAGRLVLYHLRPDLIAMYNPSVPEGKMTAAIIVHHSLAVLEAADDVLCSAALADRFGEAVLARLCAAMCVILLDSGPRTRVITAPDAKSIAQDVQQIEGMFLKVFAKESVVAATEKLRTVVRLHALPSSKLQENLVPALLADNGWETLDVYADISQVTMTSIRARILNFRRYSTLPDDKKVRSYLHGLKAALKKGRDE